MKRIALFFLLAIECCFANTICIENCTEETVRIRIKQKGFILKNCVLTKLGIMFGTILEEQEILLQNEEQFLFYADYLPDADYCKLQINDLTEFVDLMDYTFPTVKLENFSVESHLNDLGDPFPGKAMFCDRLYVIRKAKSAPTTPTGRKESSTRKRAGSF